MDEKQERTWGMLYHLGALAGYIIPLGNIIGPGPLKNWGDHKE
jgi:uncharacterized Tic20 family protein